jgi:hypothetical protein
MSQLVLLSADEQQALESHESTIERGLKTFVEVGNALSVIREARLYRASHATFEGYCQERWGFTDRHARRFMESAAIVANLKAGPTGPVLPERERQARPLASLAPEQQPVAWQRAVEAAPNGKVTAAHVQSVVNEFRQPAPPTPALFEEEDRREPAPILPAVTPHMAVHYTSDTPEWYTPAHIIARAIKALGAIDLDPCSNSRNAPNVPAAKHFTEEDNGLIQPWHGRVYMNPPYGRIIGEWAERLVREFDAGRVTEAVALVPARTDTEWFRAFRRFPRCFLYGRLKFSDHDNSAPFPSVAIYLGSNLPAFALAFDDIGDIYQLVGD